MKIKSFLIATLIAVAALAVSPPSALAQPVPTYSPQRAAGSNAVAQFLVTAGAATNIGILIPVNKQKDVSVQVSSTNTTFYTTLSTANTLVFYYTRSVDGINWDSTLTPAGAPALVNGTNTTTWLTNLASQGAGYIYIPYITNASGTGTNTLIQSIKYGVKIGSP